MSSKRFKAFVVAMLGVFLSVAVAGTAQADPSVSFTVSPQQVVVGQPVTVTDTTSNPDGHELTYKWSKDARSLGYDIQSGSPECLNAECSQARWSYDSPGEYMVSESVSWPEGQHPSVDQFIRVVPASEAPAPIILNGPTTVKLPTVLDVMSPKKRMWRYSCIHSAYQGSEWQFCRQYLIKRVGPDANGFYHYRYRLPMAYPGPVELTFIAWNDDPKYADSQTFTINVTGNSYRFGDIRSCHWPTLLKPDGRKQLTVGGKHIRDVYELHYFAAMNSRVAMKLQVRRGKRWVTKKVKRADFPIHTRIISPWTRRDLRARFGPAEALGRNRRVIYEIRKGRKLLKRGHLSKRRCTWH